MDQDRFDQLARALAAGATRRAGLRAALGGLLGIGLGAATLDADARRTGNGKDRGRAGAAKRRHECGPGQPCPTGYDCVKQGRKRRCSCSTGVTCAGACCPTGQACQDGACVVPATCIAPGEPCKGVGKPCCDGRTCSSGQGGEADVACYVHKTGACQSTSDCVYGTACIDGRCGFDVPPPAPLGASCNPEIGQQCSDPAAVCTVYDGPDAIGAPAGAHCTLPLNTVCSGDPDCTCYRCWYENSEVGGADAARRDARSSSDRLACCGPAGYACRNDRNCCIGSVCVDGVCQAETTCDVCASGCPYTSIVAAYQDKAAGSSISIAPGTYDEPQLLLEYNTAKDMTFRRCGLSGRVLWRNVDPGSQDYVVKVDLDVEYQQTGRNSNLTFVSIDFDARGNSYGVLSSSGGWDEYADDPRPRYRSRIVMMDCRIDGQQRTPINARKWSDTELYDSAFTNASLRPGGTAGAINANGYTAAEMSTLLAVRCRFTGNTAPSGGGAIMALRSAVTLVDTIVSDNRCTTTGNPLNDQEGGGGLWLDNASTLALRGSSVVTGNAIPAGPHDGGSGIQISAADGSGVSGRLSGVSSATVTGNTPAAMNCAMVIPDDVGYQDIAVSCDQWCLPTGTKGSPLACTLCCSGGCDGGGICT